MVKVTTSPNSQDGWIIRIDGALVAAALPELERSIAGPRSAATLAIDLSGVTSVDPAARDFLLGIRRQGVRLIGASLYVTQLLSESSR